SCALPPVRAKPNPSMLWNFCLAFTSIVGRPAIGFSKRRPGVCKLSSELLSGVVSHREAVPFFCAPAGKASPTAAESRREETSFEGIGNSWDTSFVVQRAARHPNFFRLKIACRAASTMLYSKGQSFVH